MNKQHIGGTPMIPWPLTGEITDQISLAKIIVPKLRLGPLKGRKRDGGKFAENRVLLSNQTKTKRHLKKRGKDEAHVGCFYSSL